MTSDEAYEAWLEDSKIDTCCQSIAAWQAALAWAAAEVIETAEAFNNGRHPQVVGVLTDLADRLSPTSP